MRNIVFFQNTEDRDLFVNNSLVKKNQTDLKLMQKAQLMSKIKQINLESGKRCKNSKPGGKLF